MIVEEMGTSKKALYYHFDSKEEFFETLYRSIMDKIE